jgi:hypothetical protein
MIQEIGFALDSPQEQAGFELPVPLAPTKHYPLILTA